MPIPGTTNLPALAVGQNSDGTISANFTVDPASLKAINWAALLQAVMAAAPYIIAIITAFTGSTPPPVAKS